MLLIGAHSQRTQKAAFPQAVHSQEYTAHPRIRIRESLIAWKPSEIENPWTLRI
jgi:hypothetical protein